MDNIIKVEDKSKEYDLVDYILFLRSKIIRIIVFVIIISALSFIYNIQKEKFYISNLIFTSEDFISNYNNLSSEEVLENQNITYKWITNSLLRELNLINETINENNLFNYVSNEEKNIIQNSFQIVKIEDKKEKELQKFKIIITSTSSKNDIKKVFNDMMYLASENVKEKLLTKIENRIADLNAHIMTFNDFKNSIKEQSLSDIDQNINRITENLAGEILVKKRIIEENLRIASKLKFLEPRMDLLQPFLFVQSNAVNLLPEKENEAADDLFMSYVKEDFPLYFLGENILALELDRVNRQLINQDLNSTKLIRLHSLKKNPNIQLSDEEADQLRIISIAKSDLDRIFIRLQNTLNNEEVQITSYQSNSITHQAIGIQMINLQVVVIFLSLMFAALFYYINFINLIRSK